jgi:glyoxylase I family protein
LTPETDPQQLAASRKRSPLYGIHHVAIIASDYEASKRFYVELLGCTVLAENYREQRQSYKLDLGLPDGSRLELFSFPHPPARPSRPEACGLRHLAFRVENVELWTSYLEGHGVTVEEVRVDEFTGHRFVFFADPDGLPIELHETAPSRAP